jgi:uncharacterized phage protein gp47/JayE
MPLTTVGPTISDTGISAPSFADILQYLQQQAQSIFGSDAYLAPDSQDGQLLALFAKAIYDLDQAAIAAFNTLSPSFAVGTSLSALVKLNGLQRKVASFSSATGNVVGVVGTTINGGVVTDTNGNKWNLPPAVVIPGAGTIAVTVTAQEPGNIVAPSGSINQIGTPTQGWQSFVSTTDAVPGDPIETDAALRARQALSTAQPSKSTLAGLLSQLLNLAGVTRCAVYENTGNAPDANGLPAHSISVVIEGGNLQAIAQTIGQDKAPGCATFGTTPQNYTDPNTGITYTINFYVLALQNVTVNIVGNAFPGWSTTFAADIQNAVSAYIDGLGIGKPIQFSRLYLSAYLNGSAEGQTYEITTLQLNGAGIDVGIPFNKAANCPPASVTVAIA